MPRPPKTILPPLTINSESIGQRISKYRNLRGFTQQELGDKIGIVQNLISDYEHGKIRLYDEMLGRFAIALKVSSDVLLGLQPDTSQDYIVSKRYLSRIKELDGLPEPKIKAILKTLDDLIKANKLH